MLHTQFPLLGYLDDQCFEFLILWMDYTPIPYWEFPDLIKYYTTNEEYTTIDNHTLLMDIAKLMYLSKPNFSEDNPNQVLHMLSMVILLSKSFYTAIGQYPTYMISSHWDYYLVYPKNV